MPVDLVLNSVKAYLSQGIEECNLAIDQGKIVKIGKEAAMPNAVTRTDLKKLLVLPGLIDAHVHLRDEGKSAKEDFHTGTAAAAAGGFTTVLDMPNNDPVTMSPTTLLNRMKRAQTEILVNVGFYSEFPNNQEHIKEIIAKGAIAFKLFMIEKVGGLDIENDEDMLLAFRKVAKIGRLVAVHAEDRALLRENEEKLKQAKRNDIKAFLAAHSENVEVATVSRLLNISKRTNTRIHFCHISSKKGLETVVNGKKSGLLVTCEVTPHHLFLSDGDLQRIGSIALTMPPVRSKRDIDALWKSTKDGSIDTVGSDHAPHVLREKKAKEVWDVKVGIPGLETTLPLLLTAADRGQITIPEIVKLASEKPAEIFGLENMGCVKEGNCANLTVIDLKQRYKIDASKFQSKAKYTPFDGWSVKGKAVKTFVNGQLIMDEGVIVAKSGSGNIITGRS